MRDKSATPVLHAVGFVLTVVSGTAAVIHLWKTQRMALQNGELIDAVLASPLVIALLVVMFVGMNINVQLIYRRHGDSNA